MTSVRTMTGALLLTTGAALACDLHTAYVPLLAREDTGRTTISLFEQYADYDQPSGGGHTFTSYRTQAAVLHRFSPTFAVQAGLPWLDKELDDDSENGIGDATLLAMYRPLSTHTAERFAYLEVYGGVKMPTGDTDPLQEEREVAMANAGHDDHGHETAAHVHGHAGHAHAPAAPAPEPAAMHGAHAHGHHLALGSGSWDGIFGLRAFGQEGRFMGLADLQYTARTEGDYDFTYGDEFTVRGGLYWYAVSQDRGTLALGVEGSVETMEENEVLGDTQEGSDKDTAYIGPALQASLRDQLAASVAWDIAVNGEDEGLHGAADTRIRGSLAFTF